MPPLSLLIKPASSNCNMRCGYCFYADEAMNRSVYSFGMMSEETLDNVLTKALAFAEGHLTIGFQGGEPTLRGLDFFRRCSELIAKRNEKGVRVQFALQTNGTMLNEEWAAFLRENKYLVGLSLDGTQAVHDRLRKGADRNGTFEIVLAAAELLKRENVDFNVLTVVTSYTAKNISRIYPFFMKNGLTYQQYIPCLDPYGEPRGRSDYSLTPPLYARFMKDLFDLWYEDVSHGRFVYVRHLENLVGVLRGNPPEHCGMLGRCSMQSVVEADGGVYPCDFYVLDKYRLGNLNEDDYPALIKRLQECAFIEESTVLPDECRACEWFRICRGGCRRDRDTGSRLERNAFCPAYKQFYAYAMPRLEKLARGF